MRSKAKRITLVSVSSQRTYHKNNKYITMKINQIVSEFNPIAAVKGAASFVKGTYDAAKAAGAAATPTVSAAKAARTAADAAGGASWVGKGAKAAGMDALGATKSSRAALKSAEYAKAAELAAQHYGSQTMKLLYALDIVKEVTVYNYQVSKLDKNAPDYEEKLRTLRGKFITAVIAPKVTIWLANKLLIGKIASAVPWIIKQFPGNRSAELAAIVKVVGVRGLEAALLAGFSTEAGKQWLIDTFGVMITGIGTIPEIASWAGSTAKAVAQVATGNLPKGYDKSTSPDMTGVDPTDPMSILQKAGEMGGRVDPFKGTGRGGK